MKVLVLLSCLTAAAFGCGGDLTGASGTFTSPNYPNAYPANSKCEWTITIPSGSVALHFTEVDIEDLGGCTYDYVKVYDGSSDALLATICGSTATSVQASSNSVRVVFTSDGSVHQTGFSATWSDSSARPPTTSKPATGCGGDLSGETGFFESPNYPNEYPSSANCEWTVTIPMGIVHLEFTHMDLESTSGCTYDSVKVYDGSSNALLASVCGTSPTKVEATANSVRIVFTSDSSVQKTGFVAKWSRLTCASKGLTCVADNASCKGSLHEGLFCENGGVCCEPPFDQGDCGVLAPITRIVGGDEAARHSWPWQVSLRTTSSNFHFCGGSILDSRWVVTAAHCVDGDTPSGLKVTTGEHDKSSISGREQDHAVEKIIMHEGYNGDGSGFPNDIALLKLAQPIVLDTYRRAICLAETEETFVGDNCFITGWGRTQGTGNEEVLNELNVNVWVQDTCANTWGSSYINAGHICVGTGDKGACNGDSGGPLACEKTRDGSSRWVLAGATSWGRSGCQTAGYPSVYSRVSYFRTWLLNTIRAN